MPGSSQRLGGTPSTLLHPRPPAQHTARTFTAAMTALLRDPATGASSKAPTPPTTASANHRSRPAASAPRDSGRGRAAGGGRVNWVTGAGAAVGSAPSSSSSSASSSSRQAPPRANGVAPPSAATPAPSTAVKPPRKRRKKAAAAGGAESTSTSAASAVASSKLILPHLVLPSRRGPPVSIGPNPSLRLPCACARRCSTSRHPWSAVGVRRARPAVPAPAGTRPDAEQRPPAEQVSTAAHGSVRPAPNALLLTPTPLLVSSAALCCAAGLRAQVPAGDPLLARPAEAAGRSAHLRRRLVQAAAARWPHRRHPALLRCHPASFPAQSPSPRPRVPPLRLRCSLPVLRPPRPPLPRARPTPHPLIPSPPRSAAEAASHSPTPPP